MSNEGDMRGGPGRPRAFLSYSRADQAQARALADALSAAGIDVWWDSMIEGGAAFARSIEAALESSDAVVVLWSAHAVASDWVLDEAGRGRDLRKLVPVALDGTEPPMGFRQYQAIDLRGWRPGADDAPVARIVRAIAARRDGATEPARVGATAPAAPVDRGRRRVLVGAGLAATLLVGAGIAWRYARRGAAVGGDSVAVLPFDNLAKDPEQAYFSDGLTEEVRSTLARNPRLRVMAQASAGRFRDSDDGAVDIAAALGVAFLLDGSVRRAGDTVRVSADLVDGATGFSRWSTTFERRIDDVFAVQREIADAVADALAAEVEVPAAGSADERAASGSTDDVAAFDAYLRGRALYDLSADEATERAALAQFEAAIAIDADYAAAHAARARSLTAIANQYGAPGANRALYDAAVDAAQRAIALAPRMAEAHSTLGFVLFQGRLDARAARAPFERSAELGAGEATVQARWSQYCARVGRDADAVAAMQRALHRDGLNPLIHRAAGAVEYAARRWQAALDPLRRALSMNPRMSRAQAAIGDALLQLGDLDGAQAAYAAEPLADFRLAGLAVVAHRRGDTAGADAAFGELVSRLGDRVLYQQAQVLAQRGATDAALQALERARASGDSGLVYARNDPLLDPLRGSPRLTDLLAAIGFEPA